jgi:SAM-dependent methyltransferase
MGAEQWDQRYGGPGYAYGTEPNAWLKDQAECLLGGGRRVLSLAEGEGRNAAYLASLGLDVTAVDQSSVGLAKAQALASERGVQFATVQADLGDYEFGLEAWDGIVSVWCHLPSALRRQVHAKVVKALKRGGWFILEAYGPGQLALGTGGPKDPDFLASEERLGEELRGLDWRVRRVLRREVREGAYHEGLSEVVQLTGRKPLEGVHHD